MPIESLIHKAASTGAIDSAPSRRKTVDRIWYILDERNMITGTIVPFDLWREVHSEKETAYFSKVTP
jgi:hypothetical protein